MLKMIEVIRRIRTFPKSFVDILPFAFLLAIIPITYWFEVWVVLPTVYPIQDRPKTYCLLFAIAHFLLINIVGNLLGIVVTDTSIKNRPMPSMDSPLAAGYCDSCCSVTPARTYHCPTCKVCILRRDHHCAFTACCIGLFNYRFFLMFLLHMFCGIALCLPFNVIFTWDFCTWTNLSVLLRVIFPVLIMFLGSKFTSEQGYLVICAISVAGMFFIGLWFYFHLRLALSGQVVHEHRHNINVNDQGKWENLKEVLGRRWYLVWISPFIDSDLSVNYLQKTHAN